MAHFPWLPSELSTRNRNWGGAVAAGLVGVRVAAGFETDVAVARCAVVGDGSGVSVTSGVGEFSGVGLNEGRGVKVGRGVRVGVTVAFPNAIRFPVSQASTVSTASAATRGINNRLIFKSNAPFTVARLLYSVVLDLANLSRAAY